MSSIIKLVQNDTGPNIDVTLVDPDNNNAPINVSGSTVNFYFKQVGSTGSPLTIACTKPNGGADGVVRITWPNGALAVAGDYEGEIEINTSGVIQTVQRKLKFRVRSQIG